MRFKKVMTEFILESRKNALHSFKFFHIKDNLESMVKNPYGKNYRSFWDPFSWLILELIVDNEREVY